MTSPARELRGVLPVFQTPYHSNETIDFATLEREIAWLHDCGAHGIVMAMVSETLGLALTDAQLPGLTVAQLQSMATDKLNVLTATQFANLTTAQIAALTTGQVGSLTSAQVQALTNAQLVAVETADLAAFRKAQWDSLTTGQVQTLSTDQVASLRKAQFSLLSTTAVAALTTEPVRPYPAGLVWTPLYRDRFWLFAPPGQARRSARDLLAELRELDEDIRLGPSTGSIVNAAVARGRPGCGRSSTRARDACRPRRASSAEPGQSSCRRRPARRA